MYVTVLKPQDWQRAGLFRATVASVGRKYFKAVMYISNDYQPEEQFRLSDGKSHGGTRPGFYVAHGTYPRTYMYGALYEANAEVKEFFSMEGVTGLTLPQLQKIARIARIEK